MTDAGRPRSDGKALPANVPERILIDALDTLPLGIALFDPDDRLVLHNKMYFRERSAALPGTRFEDMLRQFIAEGRLSDAHGREEDWLRERMEQHRRADKTLLVQFNGIWSRVHEHRTSDGWTLLVTEDFSDIKKAEAEAVRQETLLRAVLDTLAVPVYWKDRNGAYRGCNETFLAARQLDGPDKVIGRTIRDIVLAKEEGDAITRADEAVMTTGQPRLGIEDQYLRPDGSVRIHLANKVPFRDARGAVVGLVGSFLDVTERRRAEDALREQKQLLEILIEAIPLPLFLK
jgi:PAS domain S-box-containing protein